MKHLTSKIIVSFLFAFFGGLILFGTLNAEDTKFRDQALRFGLNAGLQFNSVSLGLQNLERPYPAFQDNGGKFKDNADGKGLGVYGGLFGEYLSDSWWGIQLRASYDMRDAFIKDTTTMLFPNADDPGRKTRKLGAEYDSYMNYLSWELLFRADQHLIPNLNFYVGPIIAINIHGTYRYKNKEDGSETTSKVENRNIVSYGLSGGLAYDIEISKGEKSSFYLSPFAEASWIVNQKKSDYSSSQNSVLDVWSTLSYRFGIRASLEFRNKEVEKIVYKEKIIYVPYPVNIAEPPAGKKVYVVMPYNNVITTKNVTGYFPILPYVFFEKGNREIPSRYIMLSKSDAQNFNESELGNFKKGDLTIKQTNINQLMLTYCNVMNVYGARMRNNPNVQLTLTGSDPEEKDGEACAIKVKAYLVDNFGIDAGRIKIVVESPRKPSGSAMTDPAFSGMIDNENHRVGFVFSNQDMYKPIPYTFMDESSIDNDMVFSISDNVQFKSWTLTITGENNTMSFGPFKSTWERINPAPLMRGIDEGKFNATVVIKLQDGSQVTEEVDFKLYKEKEYKNATRYLMVFEYNKSDAVQAYETKIREEIVPGMKAGNRVIIHGHTDIIGNETANQKLSQERADQAKRIVDDQLKRDDKKINVQAIGSGQTKMQYTFDNQLPEGRMYNRNVFVETIQ